MVSRYYTGSHVFYVEGGYVMKVFVIEGWRLEGHAFTGACVVGGISSEDVFRLPADVYPLDMMHEDDHLCIEMKQSQTRIVTDPIVGFDEVEDMDVLPSQNPPQRISIAPERRKFTPRLPGMVTIPPPTIPSPSTPPLRKP